jgi:hypothetical protein
MAASGTSIRDAMDLFGHADARLMLEVYAQASEYGKRAAMDALGAHYLAELGDESRGWQGATASPGD